MRYSQRLRIREVELARHAAGTARIFILDRSDALSHTERGFLGKLALRWKLAMGGTRQIDAGEIIRFRMPVFTATGPVANRLAAVVNEKLILGAKRRFGCDMVFHSNPFLFLPPESAKRSYRYHFDLVDNFFDEWPDSFVGRSRRRFLRDTILRADSLSACSLSLCDRVEEFMGRKPVFVPNGAALEDIRAWPPARAEAMRAKLDLKDRRVLAYIGNHFSDFDGMELLLDAFVQARRSKPELALMIVGNNSDRVAGQRGLGPSEGVHVIGPVPVEEVWDYFHAADLGLLPFVPRPVTHEALPLKVLEFGAASRPMLATPLRELTRIALPHVRFAAYETDAWCEALVDDATYATPDEALLESALEQYSWQAAADKLLSEMGVTS